MKKVSLLLSLLTLLFVSCPPPVETVKVSFDVNQANNKEFKGETPATIEVEKGTALKAEQLVALADTKSYLFLGWFIGETQIKVGDKVTKDVLLKAQWGERPIITYLSPGTNGTAGTEATYVEFGHWPQTIKKAECTITGESKEMGMFTYYKGDDGEWYVECQENACKNTQYYIYSNGKKVKSKSANSKQWFKVEPIKWRVVTNNYNGKKLLLAEHALIDDVGYYDDGKVRTIDEETIYPNNYQHSKIRAWLNGLTYNKNGSDNGEYNNKGFLQTAFTAEELEIIMDTVVDNSAVSTIDAGNNLVQAIEYTCDNTTDKIFLLSEKEVTTSAYGFTAYNAYGEGNSRIRKPTDFALANFCSASEYGCHWWLRSPLKNSYARVISTNGGASGNQYVVNTSIGVVPALCIK